VAEVDLDWRRVDAFVTAEEASFDAFLSVSAASPYQPQLQEYLESLVQQRCTRADWCLLGLEAGTPVARAALWACRARRFRQTSS
jgi:hypothetical protein